MSKAEGKSSRVLQNKLLKENEMAKEKETPKRVSRKEFVKGAAVGGAGVAAAGVLASCSPAAAPAPTTAPEATATLSPAPESSPSAAPSGPVEWDSEADVVVVGGGSGMMAAMEAHDAGVKVILLEKEPILGGDSTRCGGVLYAGGTSVQEAGGVVDDRTGQPDTVERAYEDWIRHGEGEADPELARKIIEMGPALIDWFVERGVEFSLYTSGPDPVKRGHTAGGPAYAGYGGAYTEVMVAEVEQRGIEVYTETKALEILRNEEGQIIGVEAKTKDGDIKYFGGKAVILASGGSTHNLEMIMRYNPEAIDWLTIMGPWHTGDGIIMGDKLNAGFIGLQKLAGAGVLVFVGTSLIDQLVAYYEWVKSGPKAFAYVNLEGKRFVDETQGYAGATGLSVADQTRCTCICVFDQTLYDLEGYNLYAVGGSKEALADAVDSGLVKKADTIEELAELLAIDGETLKQTIDTFNGYASRGEDPQFARPAGSLQAIVQPPFYGFTTRTSGRDASISFEVNADCQVLDRDGWVIPGLYTEGLGLKWRAHGRGYAGSGASIAQCFATGRVAGKNAAAYVKSL